MESTCKLSLCSHTVTDWCIQNAETFIPVDIQPPITYKTSPSFPVSNPRVLQSTTRPPRPSNPCVLSRYSHSRCTSYLRSPIHITKMPSQLARHAPCLRSLHRVKIRFHSRHVSFLRPLNTITKASKAWHQDLKQPKLQH
jgi:hypothetical protein